MSRSYKTPKSGGSVPQTSGGKRRSFQRDTSLDMRKALDAALKRLGEPDRNYRAIRNNFVRAKTK